MSTFHIKADYSEKPAYSFTGERRLLAHFLERAVADAINPHKRQESVLDSYFWMIDTYNSMDEWTFGWACEMLNPEEGEHIKEAILDFVDKYRKEDFGPAQARTGAQKKYRFDINRKHGLAEKKVG